MMFSRKFSLETDVDRFYWLKESLSPDKIALEKKDASYFEDAVNDLGGLLSCCSTLLKIHRYFLQTCQKTNNKYKNG